MLRAARARARGAARPSGKWVVALRRGRTPHMRARAIATWPLDVADVKQATQYTNACQRARERPKAHHTQLWHTPHSLNIEFRKCDRLERIGIGALAEFRENANPTTENRRSTVADDEAGQPRYWRAITPRYPDISLGY